MDWKATAILRPMHVLIVDPDDRHRLELMHLLKTAKMCVGMVVNGVGSASEAIERFRYYHPDLLLISGGDFFAKSAEIIREIRSFEGNRHTGIIIANRGHEDEGSRSVAVLEMGADDYLRSDCSDAELVARVRSVLRLKAMTDELRQANHKLEVLSLTDDLTGLANMRCFNQRYVELLDECRKGSFGAGILMLDIDHFKSVNDSTNHLVGSHVLSGIGRLLPTIASFGDRDILARFGGDEFIVACEAMDYRYLRDLGEALRQAIAEAAFDCEGHHVRVHASIGVAWVERGFRGRAEDIIKAADLMLYRSKNSGRNIVSGMVLKYPVQLDLEQAERLARRGDVELLKDSLEKRWNAF